MGYTKKWVPPTIPLRDDLAAWKTLFQDLHDNLILAGLVQSATSGQLDISAVSTLPADGTFEGFIEYELDDALQGTTPITIKLEYGCGIEGLSNTASANRTRTPRIRCTVLMGAVEVATFQTPQSYNYASTGTSQLTAYGNSIFCTSPDDGFYGFVYGAGSRNKPFSNNPAQFYYGATFALFIQRPLDANGIPRDGMVAVYHPNISSMNNGSALWTTGVVQLSQSVYASGATGVVTTNGLAPRIGREGISASADRVLLEPINYPSSPAEPFPYIVSYRNTDIGAGQEFGFAPFAGPPRNFIAIGNETCFSIDSVDGQRAGIAMLFE